MKTLIEVVLQTLLSFFSVLFVARILGRQHLAELTIHEYITAATLGSIAATLAIDLGQESWSHFVGLFLFGALTYLTSYLNMKSRSVSKFIQGEPVLVIQDGHILEKNLQKFNYTVDDLTHLLRKKDIFSVNDVKYGILETTGELSIVKAAQKENLKVEDLHLSVDQGELNTDIIVTGSIIYENLVKRNLSVKWLLDQLKAMGVKDIKDIYYSTIDKDNKIYLDYFSDKLENPAKTENKA